MFRRLLTLLLSDRYFGRVVLALVGIGFVALLSAALSLVVQSRRNEEMQRLVVHTLEVDQTIGDFLVQVERMEAARRGLLLDQDIGYLRVYDTARAEVPELWARIRALTADNPAQVERARILEVEVLEQRRLLDSSVNAVRAGQVDSALSEYRADISTGVTRRIRAQGQAMRDEERGLLAARNAAQAEAEAELRLILLLAGALIVVVGTVSILVILRYTRDLSRSRNELKSLNENLEDAVAERTTDLQRANDEIQRFAYIVSHDLRSPLVNVMGFTAELDTARKPILALLDRAEAEAPDLVDEEARLAVREDMPEAIGFIRSSTQKMDRLIGAILKLSREGRRSIAPETIDLDQMVGGIIDSLRHRTGELGAEIAIEGKLPPIVSDRLAMEQVLSNLIENAVKYLKPGRPGRVIVRGARRHGRLIYEISDNGRGIDPRDHQRVFDLFRRSGEQDQPGEGIGLAHVRALVYRLGGIIELESALDQGATFRLVLPATNIASGEDLP